MKKLIALIVCTALLSGCVPHTELDRQGIAEAVGVDLEGGIYTVTVQYFNTDSSGGVTAVDSSAPNVTVAEGKGRSIESALQALSYTTGCEMMLGAVSFIVFGESALGELDESLSLAASHYSGNLRADIAAARGKAADIMNVQFSEGNASVEKLGTIFSNAEKLGLTRRTRLFEALERLSSIEKSVAVPLLQAYPADSDLTEDGNSLVITGGAVYSDGDLEGEMTVREMSGLGMIFPDSGSTRECELTLSYCGKDTRVLVYGISAVTKPSFDGDELFVKVSVNADCKIISTAVTDPYSAKEDIERLCEKEITERIESALDKVLRHYGADVFGLSYLIRSRYPERPEYDKEKYGELLRNCVTSVSASIRMERFGTLSSSSDKIRKNY